MASRDSETVQQRVKNLMREAIIHAMVDKLRMVGGGDGHCVCEMTVEEKHRNINGTLHGAVTALLVNLVATMALLSSERAARGASVELNVSYLNPAKVGEEIIIEGKTRKAGQKLAFLSVDIFRKSDGVLLAQGKQTTYIPTSRL